MALSAVTSFDCHDAFEFTRGNHFTLPVVSSVLYLAVVFLGPMWMQRRAAFPLRRAFAAWNFFLSAFSTVAVCVCLPYALGVWWDQGVHGLICSDTMMFGEDSMETGIRPACYGTVGFFMTAFMVSKFPELLDTVFLVLMKKPVIFLHWYHHFTVLLYCWYAFTAATPSAVFLGTMNYCVHSVMYAYFGAALYTRKLGFLRQPITTLQLGQMVIGMLVTCLTWYYHWSGQGCSRTYMETHYYLLCGTLYGSYFLLFAKLYVDNYRTKMTRKPKNA